MQVILICYVIGEINSPKIYSFYATLKVFGANSDDLIKKHLSNLSESFCDLSLFKRAWKDIVIAM